MKKTMFITSVIMVVVMAIALTTSSLAWFSAQGATTVNTSKVAISAKANSSTGLYISNDGAAWQQNALAITSPVTERYVPVAPFGSTDEADAADLLEGLQKDQFVTNTVKVVSGGDRVWAAAYSEAATNFYKEQNLYVANAGDAAIAVSADIDFTDVHGATLYVAVLARHKTTIHEDPEDDVYTDWKLIRLESSDSESPEITVARYELTDEDDDEEPAYGKNNFFWTGELVEDACELDVTPGANQYSKTPFNLAGKTGNAGWGEYMQVKILAWYSANLTNTNSGSYYELDNQGHYTETEKEGKTYAEFTVTFSRETANAVNP